MTVMPSPLAAAEPDAELLALGVSFSTLLPVYVTAEQEAACLHAEWNQAVASRGIRNWAGIAPAQRRVVDRLGVATGYYAASDRKNELVEELVRLSAAIREHKPTTIAGLAAWARAAQFEASDHSDPKAAYEASDDSTCQIHELTAHIERMAGEA